VVPHRKILTALAVTGGVALVIASLLVAVRAWSAACCDPSGIMHGQDGGMPLAWPDDLDRHD
jgi:hypothetical protein